MCALSIETSSKRLGPVSRVNLQTEIISSQERQPVSDAKWRAGWFYQATVAEWDYRMLLFLIKICFCWRQHFDHFYLLVSRLLIVTHGGYAARAKEQHICILNSMSFPRAVWYSGSWRKQIWLDVLSSLRCPLKPLYTNWYKDVYLICIRKERFC